MIKQIAQFSAPLRQALRVRELLFFSAEEDKRRRRRRRSFGHNGREITQNSCVRLRWMFY